MLAHRVLWTVAFSGAALVILRRTTAAIAPLGIERGRLVLTHLASGLLLFANWLTYVYAVFFGRVVEASMGYYINPLVSVLLAVVVLGERLRPAQIAATALLLPLAAAGPITAIPLIWFAAGFRRIPLSRAGIP